MGRSQEWGRRCDLGCETWPDSDDYAVCPMCGEEAFRFSNMHPLDADVARSLVSNLKFEEYYEDRCERRGITADGPLIHKATGEPVPFEDDRVWQPSWPLRTAQSKPA